MFALIFLWGVQFTFLPSHHYHPETTHSHGEHAKVHKHQGGFHAETLEAYAHMVKGHFSDPELDDHFHHSHSADDHEETDSGNLILLKHASPLKEGLVFKQLGYLSPFEFTSSLNSVSASSETIASQSRWNRSPNSSRSPPYVIL